MEGCNLDFISRVLVCQLMNNFSFGNESFARRLIPTNLRRTMPTILDICMVRKVNEPITSHGIATKFWTSNLLDQVNSMVAHSKHSGMKTWDNYFQHTGLPKVIWILSSIRRKKTSIKLHASDSLSSHTLMPLQTMSAITLMHSSNLVSSIRRICKRVNRGSPAWWRARVVVVQLLKPRLIDKPT